MFLTGTGHAIKAGGFNVDLRMRRFFFDRPGVISAIGKKKARALNRAGTFLRRAGRKLLGQPSKKQKPRPAGKPPRVHTTDERVTLRNILYYHDAAHDSVICGPVKLNQVNLSAIELQSVTVPELHEFGGEVLIQEEQWKSEAAKGTWRRRDLRRNLKPGKNYRTRRAHYPARPTMRPALLKTIPKVPELFGGTSRGELFSPGSI
jgi:hypothetical protein